MRYGSRNARGRIMIQSIERVTLLDMLINSLEVERYVRGPLLQSVVDELGDDRRLSLAAALAKSLLVRLEEGIGNAEFERTVRELRELVHAA